MIVDQYDGTRITLCDQCRKMIHLSGYQYEVVPGHKTDFCQECGERFLESHPGKEKFIREFRICDHCKLPMFAGMTDLCNTYAHEGECFEEEMNKLFGKGHWRQTEEEGEEGGYYEYEEDGKWTDTGIFYTEWEAGMNDSDRLKLSKRLSSWDGGYVGTCIACGSHSVERVGEDDGYDGNGHWCRWDWECNDCGFKFSSVISFDSWQIQPDMQEAF